MEFKNVVFNAARDGKLRRLKVRWSTALWERVPLWISLMLDRYGESLSEKKVGEGCLIKRQVSSKRSLQLGEGV